MRLARHFVPLLVSVLVALAAAPSWAYTIYLKDGTRIVARDKYTVEGDLAILYQPSGTKSSMPVALIDVKRTEEANVNQLSSTATAIEGGQATEAKRSNAPVNLRPRIQDLIKSDEAGIRADRTAAAPAPLLPAAAARSPERDSAAGGGPKRSDRAPFANVGLAGEIRGFVTTRGVTAVEVYAGASPTWPLLVYATESEGAVFKALLTGANALIHFKSARPGQIDGLEIVCESSDGGSGGRFTLTSEQASDIVSGRSEITRFYVENVQF